MKNVIAVLALVVVLVAGFGLYREGTHELAVPVVDDVAQAHHMVELRYVAWPQAPHIDVVPAVVTFAEIDPANPDLLTQADLVDGVANAIKGGQYLILVVLAGVALLWTLRTGLLKLSDAEYTWFHTTVGTALSGAALGFLLSVSVALTKGSFTWASAGLGLAAAVATSLTALLADKHPSAAVAAAKAA